MSVAASLMLAVVESPVALAQQGDAVEAPDPVERKYQLGLAAARQGDFTEARRHYREAWRQRKTHDVAANLGGAEFQLGAFRDAAEHLRYALDHLAASKATEKRDAMLRDLALAKKEIVTLQIRIQPDNAKVWLNGALVGVASSLPLELYADAGPVSVRVELGGFMTKTIDLIASRGDERTLELSLPRETGAEEVKRRSTTAVPMPRPAAGDPVAAAPRRNLVPAAIGAGVAVLALASGVGFAVDSSNARTEATEAQGAAATRFGTTNPCSPSRGLHEPECTALNDARDREARSARVANGSFVVAGVAAVFALGAYVYWPAPERSTGSKLALSASPDFATVVLTGRF